VTAVSKAKPQVIDDEEHERVHERVAAVDVAKDTGMVCTRLPHPSRPGARQSTVWTVRARMAAIRALGRQLVRDGVEVVTLESTSDYWRIWFFVLEGCGLVVQLVSAAQAKNLPGRPKTDKLDAMWLARLTEMGLLRASFVPPKAIRDLRDYTRARTRLTQERTRCFQRPGKAAGIGPGQALVRGQQADHYLRAGHDQGDDRRAARPPRAGRPGPYRDEGPSR
jgi:transposase